MRKSDYPKYFGGPDGSRGPRTFRHWFHCLDDYPHDLPKKRKRWLISRWLIDDCPELLKRVGVSDQLDLYKSCR